MPDSVLLHFIITKNLSLLVALVSVIAFNRFLKSKYDKRLRPKAFSHLPAGRQVWHFRSFRVNRSVWALLFSVVCK